MDLPNSSDGRASGDAAAQAHVTDSVAPKSEPTAPNALARRAGGVVERSLAGLGATKKVEATMLSEIMLLPKTPRQLIGLSLGASVASMATFIVAILLGLVFGIQFSAFTAVAGISAAAVGGGAFLWWDSKRGYFPARLEAKTARAWRLYQEKAALYRQEANPERREQLLTLARDRYIAELEAAYEEADYP